MPLYDFQCESCGKEFEQFATIPKRKEVRCPDCNGATKVLITSTKSKHWFQPHWNPEFTGEPVWVRSLNHYKDLCLRHNVTSRAIGDFRDYTHRRSL